MDLADRVVKRIKEELKPVGAYLMESGPFGSNTLLLVMDEEGLERVERFLEDLDVDFDVAVITPEEFERLKDTVSRSGRKLW